jgi:hypothetical protein
LNKKCILFHKPKESTRGWGQEPLFNSPADAQTFMVRIKIILKPTFLFIIITIFFQNQATLVRNIDGTHALHRVAAAQQPQLVQIEGSDQTFEVTPFGLRSLPLGARFAQAGPIVLRSAPNAHFIQA